MGIIIGAATVIIGFTLLGVVLWLFYSSIAKAKIAADGKMTDELFCVMLPKAILILGVVVVFMCAMVILFFSIFPKNPSEAPTAPQGIVFFIVFGGFSLLGLYLALRAAKFKVVVEGEKVTVYPIFIKPYTFTFYEIVSVIRQVSKNKLKSEGLLIKTISGKNLRIESAEISYDRFLRRIKAEVKSELLIGFEDEGCRPQ